MNAERRAAPRSPARVLFNRYVDGQPQICEAVELSTTGMLARRVHAPEPARDTWLLEMAPGPLQPGEERAWVCATPVWQKGEHEALSFVECSDRDRELIEAMVARAKKDDQRPVSA
jgi:hypothetical protein